MPPGANAQVGGALYHHPVAVATILAEMGMTTPTLVAALLHDTVEDTDYTLQELAADFGEPIANLVDGVTKLDKVRYGAAAQSETLRKMLVAMSRDIRVLLIKLADRIHNARTWRFRSGRIGGEEGAGNAGDLRAAGPPTRHEHGEVGARRTLLQDPVPGNSTRRSTASSRRGPLNGKNTCATSSIRSKRICAARARRARSVAARRATIRSTRR